LGRIARGNPAQQQHLNQHRHNEQQHLQLERRVVVVHPRARNEHERATRYREHEADPDEPGCVPPHFRDGLLRECEAEQSQADQHDRRQQQDEAEHVKDL